MKHTTEKVDKQGEIISGMWADKVMDTGAGKRETEGVNM